MPSASNLTFTLYDIVKIIGGLSVVVGIYIALRLDIKGIEGKIDVLIAQKDGENKNVELKFSNVQNQLDIHSLTLKTMADFLKPEPPTIKRDERH